MDTSEISNVLVFKEGYYYLSREVQLYNDDGSQAGTAYLIVDTEMNGFEFASDAYSYLVHIQKEGAN